MKDALYHYLTKYHRMNLIYFKNLMLRIITFTTLNCFQYKISVLFGVL